jgi:hypothetical protein
MIATLLALRIDERNSLVQSNPSSGNPWDFKGLILGNPLIDPSVDATPSLVETLYQVGVLPHSLYDEWSHLGCSLLNV